MPTTRTTTTTTPTRVGGEIRAACRRCGDVWHVVIAHSEGRIARVECRECGANHRYRPVGGSTRAPVAARRRSAAKKPVVEADPSRPSRPFKPSETYRIGDRVVHARFGEGVVQALAGPKKVEILFDAGSKLMVHAREEG